MTWTSESDHPGLDTWIAYRGGELPPEREDELRDHLVDCPECLALVRDLAAFEAAEAGPAEEPSAGDPATAAAIDAVVRRARAEGEVRRLRPRSGPSAWLLPLAASLLVAAAVASLVWGLSLQSANRTLEERIARLSEPRPDVAIEDLYPSALTRNGRSGETRVTVAPGTPFVTWLIHLPPGARDDRYRAELRDAEGRSVWRGGGLTRDPRHHTVTLGMAGDRVGAGRSVLRLWPGDAPEDAEPIALYELDVRREEPRSPE